MIFRALLVLASLIGALPSARAQEATMEMLHRNWTTRDGLPQDHVRAMVRTRDGFLWLGTDSGLARFDGFEFKTYGLHEGLGAVAVLALLESSDGTLWAGTMGGGVSALRGGKVVRTYTRADGLPSETVSRLAEDDQGSVWVADRAGNARLVDGRIVPAGEAPDRGTSWIIAMHRTMDGTLWVSLPSTGVWRWKAGRWSPKPEPGLTGVTAFCEDGQGRLWAADGDRTLWCFDNESWQSFPPPEKPVNYISSLAAGLDGTIWLASFRSGLRGFRDGAYLTPHTRGEPFFDLAETVHATADGQLWLGSSTQGLYALSAARLQMVLVDDKEGYRAANFIGALVESAPGEFLVGTQGRGLYRLANGLTVPVPDEPELKRNRFVNCMLKTAKGEIWTGWDSGLVRFRNMQRIPLPDDEAFALDAWELCEDRRGGLWFGSGGGILFQLADDGAKAVDFGSRLVPIKGLAQQDDGTLWVGTRGNGLFCRTGDQWRRYGKGEGLPSEVIRVIHISKDGTVWVGTAGGGLALKRGDRFGAVTTRDGLPDDTVSQIAEDEEGRLWLGTNRGLTVLSAKEVSGIKSGKSAPIFPRVVDRFDGLISEEFTIAPPVKTTDGRLAFGTTRGFALLRPEDFHADETTPPVFLEEVRADGRPLTEQQGTIEVPPGVKRLEFRFTGLHFAAPERVRFRNRLEGIEEDWGAANTSRSAEYRNVEPGHYRFEVSASTGNGLWSGKPAAIGIRIRPHFWQTGGFRAAVIVGVLGALVLGVRQRERQRAARRIQQLERQQAVDGERARIARDLHDDVGASLTQVALLSQLARNNLTKRPERAGQHVQQIFDTAKEVTRSLDEIVWAVNPQNDTLESFALFLGAFVQNYSHAAGLRCRFDVPENLPAASLEASIRHHLYLATKEVIHNVAKHADAQEIRLSLALEPGAFRLTIEDDGRGFDSSAPDKPDADGLLNLQSRLKQLGGTCARRSEPGKGTSVEMKVPLAVPAVE